MIVKTPAQQRLNDIQDDQEKFLVCQAQDHGWNGYIKCLEDSIESRACKSRVPFGFGFLCDNTAKIEWMRKWERAGK